MILPPFPGAVLVRGATDPPGEALALCRALLAPGAALHLLGQLPPQALADRWLTTDPWSALERHLAESEHALEALAEALRAEGWRCSAEVSVAPEAGQITAGLQRVEGPLVVISPALEPEQRRHWTELALDEGRVLAWPGERLAEPIRHVLVPLALGPLRTRARPGLFADPGGLRITVLELRDGEATRSWERLRASSTLRVRTLTAPLGRWTQSLEALIEEEGVDLVLAPTPSLGELGRGALARALMSLEAASPVPVLLAVGAGELDALGPELGASDLLLVGGALVGAVERRSALGAARPMQGTLRLIDAAGGRHEAQVEGGVLRCPLAPEALHVVTEGLGLSSAEGPPRVEAIARVLRLPEEPLGLVDADRLAEVHGDLLWWAVRTDAERSLSELSTASGERPLVDVEALLDDGPVQDLPPDAEVLRLRRLARRLRARGVPVRRLLHKRGAERLPEALADPWEELCGAPSSTATGFRLDLDNAHARRRLLEMAHEAQERLHLQVYMVSDDAVVRELARALVRAAERGVRVRVLVDSLLSLHGSLGQENPVLIGLSEHPGVEVRAWRPVQQMPGLTELKQRDHRKLYIVDSARARIGGRNLGAPYLTAFEEVSLTPETAYRQVPWLDATAEVQGPVVRELERMFLEAWTESGGEAYPLPEAGPRGGIPVRLVPHRGLEDTHTLDLYRRLFDEAQERILVVNTFPLQHELQRALHRALARGVRVRLLVGNVRPHFDGPLGVRQPFPGGALRELATQVIHGRIDGLVEAGAEAFEFALRGLSGWAPDLGRVLPHVHAKLVCVDGARMSVGSANLDVTAAYWESEALLLVEDPAQVRRAEAALEALLEGSARVDPGDPDWQQRAARRGWIAQSWPGVVG